MRSYDLIQDFTQGTGTPEDLGTPDTISVSPDWVLAVVRLKYPLTYRRKSHGSFSNFYPQAVETRGQTLIIRGNCLQLQVQSTKGNHLSQLSATLLPGAENYLAEIIPGDYLAAWIVNSKEDADTLVENIRTGKPCNKFMAGLKFFGRVELLQKQLMQDPNGPRTVRYSLSGTGFSEFDATLFYDPHLAEKIDAIGQWFARSGLNINQLVTNGMIDVNKAIPELIGLLLGRGVVRNLGRGNRAPELRSTTGLEGPYSYILPTAFGALIGKTEGSKGPGVLAAADMLELLFGLQSYHRSPDEEALKVADEEERRAKGEVDESNIYKASIFIPELDLMIGRFLPTPPQFFNSSVWTILHQYLNPAMNEIFTCLRVNRQGSVVPTLVVRQLPFSTGLPNLPFAVTKFLDLPRWRIHPILVRSAILGRSNVPRFNFINVQGLAPLDKTGSIVPQLVRNPPVRDDLDCARSGLRNYTATIPCALEDIKEKEKEGQSTSARYWMDLLADILMGQHLTLTGSITIQGIQAPICIGDNIEWDGVVLHIESVSHQCSMQPNGGQKQFLTTLNLTHGLSASPKEHDISLYAGLKTQDQMDFNPPNISEEPDLNNQFEAAEDVDEGGAEGIEKLERSKDIVLPSASADDLAPGLG